MKITINRDTFAKAFNTAQTVAPSRSPKPILQNLRLDATEEGVFLMATDMEVGARIEVEGVEVHAVGSVILPLPRFGKILKESTETHLKLSTTKAGTVVKSGNSKFTLQSEDPAEFPDVQGFTETKYHEVNSKDLKQLIRRTLFASDMESGRYALGGVLLEMESDKIVAVATDGRRLAKMECNAVSVEDHGNNENMTIIPSRAMQLIERALFDIDDTVKVSTNNNSILVCAGNATIYARLVEGRFPKWKDVLPDKDETNAITMDIAPMSSGLRQAAIVASDESRGVDFSFGNNKATMSIQTAEVGQSDIEVPIEYDGEHMEITMDHRFVTDFFRSLDSRRQFKLYMSDQDTSALFTTDDDYEYVVMPLARDRG